MPNIWNLACFDYLTFTQGVRSDPLYLTINQAINLRGSGLVNQFILTVKQNLYFDSNQHFHYSICKKTQSDSIHFSYLLNPTKYATLSQYISFNPSLVKIPKVLDLNQSITLTQSFTQLGRLINGAIVFSEIIHQNTVRNILITDDLELNSNQNAIKLRYDYIQTPLINIVPNPLVSFVSTNLVPRLTLTIKAPDFEDTDELHFTKVQRNTRNNDLIVYKDYIWPTYNIFNLHFSYLLQKDIYNLLTFLQSTLGQDVIYNDFEGRSWLGLITNPIGEIIQPGRFNHQAHIVFEGELLQNISNKITLIQSNSEIKV